jgi:hypothetical protein
VAGGQREVHRLSAIEVPVDQLEVGAAHACTADLDQNFLRADLGDGDLFQPQRLLVPKHSGGTHLHRIDLSR